ncbi:hypothetical protein AYI69_g6360, partial [Smittium culicis]
MTKSFGFEQKEKARNISIFLPFVQNNIDYLNTISDTVSTSADPSVEPAVEFKGEPAVFSVAASATVPVDIPVASSASEPVVIPVAVSGIVPATVSAVVPAAVPAAATSTVPVAVTTDNSANFLLTKITASLPSSSGIPSFCVTKKKKNSKFPMKIKLDISRYAAGWNPRSANSSTSSSSATMPNAPSDQRNQHNLSAAIACSSFTPYEYSKKVKALELLTGKRDLSVNPFCKVVVTGIIPQPIRMVKKALIELTIRVEMVGKISFV